MIVEGQETYTRQRNIQSCCAQEVKSLKEERRARSEVLEPNDEDNIDEWVFKVTVRGIWKKLYLFEVFTHGVSSK